MARPQGKGHTLPVGGYVATIYVVGSLQHLTELEMNPVSDPEIHV